MFHAKALSPTEYVRRLTQSDYRRIWLLGTSAAVLSVAVIVYYSHKMYYEQIQHVYTWLELLGITLMPYMISAVVATLTAIGIMTMLPMIRSKQTAYRILLRLKRLSDGDLTVGSRVESDNQHLRDVATELNYAIGTLSGLVAQWKIINRQQWDLLEGIRDEAVSDKSLIILSLVEKMEENWKMIAQIEGRLST
ncbi:MAG: hypothetical protein JSW34_01415 [Candidatus Zixiibacteriota bacterium]|nr:MAG: hypothetical protein JSW34_01415 [candidate division Zixibacteria bacterium]